MFVSKVILLLTTFLVSVQAYWMADIARRKPRKHLDS